VNEAYRLVPKAENKLKPEKKTRPARKGLWKCKSCRKQFTVRMGTIYEESKLPLRKWLMAIHLMTSSKKGVSSHQIARELGITQKSAWFLNHRIREAMKLEPMASMLGGIGRTVEVDETYVGGKPRRVANKQYKKVGRGTAKQMVVALVEQGGRVHAAPIKQGELKDIVRHGVDKGSILVTDELRAYIGVGKEFTKHVRVHHGKNQYVDKEGYHVNTAESFFALLKRGHYGIFHQLSKK